MPNWADCLKIISRVAPMIGTAVGGPFAPLAISAIESVLKLKPAADLPARQEAVAAAVATASPDTLLALKKADEDFQAHMAELGFADAEALAKLAADDRDSARKREIAVRDWTPRILTIVTFASFIAITVYSRWLPDNRVDMSREALDALRDGVIMVLSYYFGSSSGASRGQELLAQAPAIEAR